MVGYLTVTQDGEVVQSVVTTTTLLAQLVALIIPLLVNLATKASASDGLRAIVNIVATALLAVVALWTNPSDVPITWQLAAYTFLSSLVISFTAYKAVWKPTGVSGTLNAKTANVGLGSPPTLETAYKGVEDLGQVDNDPRE